MITRFTVAHVHADGTRSEMLAVQDDARFVGRVVNRDVLYSCERCREKVVATLLTHEDTPPALEERERGVGAGDMRGPRY